MTLSVPESVVVEMNHDDKKRRTYSLNGIWEACQADFNSPIDALPKVFPNRIPVPGLWDMAEIPITGDSLWYRKTLIFDGKPPRVVLLKIGKAFWGKYIFVNGVHVADHHPNFTPAYINITDYIYGDGFRNVLLIKIGAKGTQPREAGAPTGFDFEKHRYIPGIYDDVCLIATNNPYIQNAQVAPKLRERAVLVATTISNVEKYPVQASLHYRIHAEDGTATVAELSRKDILVPACGSVQVTDNIAMEDFKFWSPETPFLYQIEAKTDGDSISSRFGMREFAFDPETKRAVLNGKPYALRGTNITMFRFFEDPVRGALPWNRDWARKVLLSFKHLNMNSMRYCIGFPPELWYELADEIGFLIDDEYPIWSQNELPDNVTESVIPELVDWIHERANHPSVVIWDLQNETILSKTVDIIQTIREMNVDLSGRPWDDGWSPPAGPTDSIECHPYLFSNPLFTLSQLNRCSPDPALYTSFAFHFTGRSDPSLVPDNPRIINEYSWLWLNRDGSPTTLTKKLFNNLLPNGSERDRRDYFAVALAQLTEFWRAGGKAAGVMDFCGLTYSKADGATCDYFLSGIEEPRFDKLFEKMMSDAMAPMGIVIEEWSETQRPLNVKSFPVSIINDTDTAWEGDVCLILSDGDNEIASETQHYLAPAWQKTTRSFKIQIPDQPGTRFCLKASYKDEKGSCVCSVRYFKNGIPVPSPCKIPISRNKPVFTSSSDEGSLPELLVSGFTGASWWRSQVKGMLPEFIDKQQVTIDLEQEIPITQIWINWGDRPAKTYAVDLSLDQTHWRSIHEERSGKSGVCVIETDERARYVRLNMTGCYGGNGYSISQIEVF